jgi:hypothetical protein
MAENYGIMKSRPRHSRRLWRVLGWTTAIFALLLVLAPVALSPLAARAINQRLAMLPNYKAQVKSVRIAVWKSAVDIEDFTLFDAQHEGDGPLVRVAKGTMMLFPRDLIRGKFRGHGSIEDTDLLVIQEEPASAKGESTEEAAKKAKERAEKAQHWQKELQERFDIEISRFEISNARMRFIDRAHPLKPELRIEGVKLVATNLKTRADRTNSLPTKLELTGRFPGGGNLRIQASVAPLEAHPRFTTSLEVKDLAMPPLHDFLQTYALVDVRRGVFEVFIEAQAAGGHYSGYVKPFFRDLEFKAVPDPEKSVVRNVATKVASTVAKMLKNEEQKVATKAPFEGDFDRNDVDLFTTIQNLLRNAFVQALREGFENEKPTP